MTTYLLDDMASFLQGYDAGALGLTVEVNLFKSLMPNKPDTVVSIYEYSGEAPEYVMGAANPLPAISHPHLQIVARDVTYPAARTTAEAVTRALETIVNESINGTLYYRVERNQDPFLLHRDKIRRIFVACNLAVEVQPS